MLLGLRLVVALSVAAAALRMSSSPEVVLIAPLACGPEVLLRRVRSSIEYAFDAYRKQLSRTMTQFDFISRSGMRLDYGDGGRLGAALFDRMLSVVAEIPSKWQRNEDLMRELTATSDWPDLIEPEPELEPVSALERESPKEDDEEQSDRKVEEPAGQGQGQGQGRPPSSYDGLEQVLLHLSRDWSAAGSALRDEIYERGIIASVVEYVVGGERASTAQLRVLVPGAGLGRLALELRRLGLEVEANESSSLMVASLVGLLRLMTAASAQSPPPPTSFFPYLGAAAMDEWSFAARLEPHTIELLSPSSSSSSPLSPLRLQLGEFAVVYSSPHFADSFDAVVTSFFIDTSLDVIRAVAIIAHVLRPGGAWINMGPLHFHSNATRVPLSHDLVQAVASTAGFVLLSERRVSCPSYAGEDATSMKPEHYIVPLSVYRLERPELRFSMQAVRRQQEQDPAAAAATPPPYPLVNHYVVNL